MTTENTKNIMTLFENEITEKGIQDLELKYPEKLIVNMKNEDEFKSARKTRTEMNKLVEAINRRRIDVTTELKEEGDNLISRIEKIYSVIVAPFEKEDKRLKEVAKKEKEKLDELLKKERVKIQEMNSFVSRSQGQNSVYIAEMIESIDLIETDNFHKDVIHEAIQTKKEVLAQLVQMLTDTKARESLEKEQAKLRLQEKISSLQNTPMSMFGKSSEEIQQKINALSDYKPKEEVFFERTEEVKALMATVLTQLDQVLQQAKFNEEQQAKIEADEKDEIDKQAEANRNAGSRKITVPVSDVASVKVQAGHEEAELIEFKAPTYPQILELKIEELKKTMVQVMGNYQTASEIAEREGFETCFQQDCVIVDLLFKALSK